MQKIELLKHNFKPHKYRVTDSDRRVVDGIKFHSLKEARYYAELKLRLKAGEVLFFLRQVPFHIPPTTKAITKYVADFVEFWNDGSCHIIDVKGFRTAEYKRKKRLVEEYYPVKIEEK